MTSDSANDTSASQLPPGRPVAVAQLLDYQAGTIVSRALVQKPEATITLFAFDQGQNLSEHTAPFDALLWVLDGAAEVEVAGNRSVVEAGQLIRLPANQPHAVRAPQRFKMLLVMIRL